MPLEILVPIVAVGILIVFLAVYFLGGGAALGDLNTSNVAERMRLDHPDFAHEHVVFDSMGRGAIVLQKRDQPMGLVWKMGRHHVTRLLDKDMLRAYEIDGPQLNIRLKDWTLRRVPFLIDDDQDLTRIRLGLDAFLK